MENVQTMSDLMQQIQQRIDSIKASAMQQQTEMKQSLNECIEQSEAIQNQLVQSQQQLTSQLEYGTAVLIELEQGLQLDFSTEIAEFEQLCQNETADTTEMCTRDRYPPVHGKVRSILLVIRNPLHALRLATPHPKYDSLIVNSVITAKSPHEMCIRDSHYATACA